MLHSKKTIAQQVVKACVLNGVDRVVVSPGSRNAPLIIEFNAYKNIKKYSLVDERAAAFFALGMAKKTKKPVALICSSGSALLNYYPAIAEAYYAEIPLIIISADRPKELIDIGDGQTIRQENMWQGNAELYTHKIWSLHKLMVYEVWNLYKVMRWSLSGQEALAWLVMLEDW